MGTEEIQNTIKNAKRYKSKEQKFCFVPVSEIVNNLKSIHWLIENYIEQHTMTLIFGDPASGKSFIAIDQACCIATGTLYHGESVSQGAVFYIAGEGHNGLGRRFKAWEKHNGVSLENAPLYVAERPAQLYDADHAQAVASAIQELIEKTGQEPCMIVIDTLARNFGGGDENSTKDMNIFIQHVDNLKDQWGAAALIVHHTGHGDKKRARGAIALKGALDHEYLVIKDKNFIGVHNTKTKDSKEPKPLHFNIATVPITLNDTSTIESAALVRTEGEIQITKKSLSSQKQKALNILKTCLNTKGKKRCIQKNMPQVLCIKEDEYRDALKFKNIVASDNPDNIRRSISRIITELNNSSITASYDGFIWLPDGTDGSSY